MNAMKEKRELIDKTLLAAGIDLGAGNESGRKNQVLDNGPAAASAIHELAEQAASSIGASLRAESDMLKDVAGMTDKALRDLKYFADLVVIGKQDHKEAIETVRQFRMTMTAEVAMIETGVKKLYALNLKTLVADFQALGKALENPAIQRLIGEPRT